MSNIEKLHAQAKEMEEFARNSDHVMGFYISGSYAKGMIHKQSDLDPVFIVEEGSQKTIEKEIISRFSLLPMDLCIYTLPQFEALNTRGTSDMGSDRYDYAHLKIPVDKTNGHIQKIINQRGQLSDEERIFLGIGYLDAYINCFYRSLKAARENWSLPQHLEAAESIMLGLSFLFAVDHRVMPFFKYLAWDLKTHPLSFPMKPDDLMKTIQEILQTGDVNAQIILFETITAHARQNGFAQVVDDWDLKPEELVRKYREEYFI